MSELAQEIIVGIAVVGAEAFLIYHYLRGRKKKKCANCPVVKSYGSKKDRTTVR